MSKVVYRSKKTAKNAHRKAADPSVRHARVVGGRSVQRSSNKIIKCEGRLPVGQPTRCTPTTNRHFAAQARRRGRADSAPFGSPAASMQALHVPAARALSAKRHISAPCPAAAARFAPRWRASPRPTYRLTLFDAPESRADEISMLTRPIQYLYPQPACAEAPTLRARDPGGGGRPGRGPLRRIRRQASPGSRALRSQTPSLSPSRPLSLTSHLLSCALPPRSLRPQPAEAWRHARHLLRHLLDDPLLQGASSSPLPSTTARVSCFSRP